MMNNRLTKIVRRFLIVLLIIIIGIIAFLLYATKDDIKANSSNIDEKLHRYFNLKRIGGGAVSVFNADSIIFMKGFGYSDVENEIPYTIHTQQMIASVSKTTIGIAILKAQEMGLLNINDPINKFLPFEVVNPYHPDIDISVLQLANHTSSLDYNEEVVESLYLGNSKPTKSLDIFYREYFIENKYGEVTYSKSPPNTVWSYSNIGASLAAYIVEKASGVPYHEFVETHIFSPLEIEQAVWFDSDVDSTQYSEYYETTKDSIVLVENSGVDLYPSRDLIFNITEFTNYCQAIMTRDPILLSEKSFNQLLESTLDKSIERDEVDDSGMFFMMKKNVSGVVYQLTGTNGGDNCIYTMMWFDPEINMGYIYMANTGTSKLNRINNIYIFNSLVSLGQSSLYENASLWEKVKYRGHNIVSRIVAIY